MGKLTTINSMKCKHNSSYLLYNGSMYHGKNLLSCLDGAMKHNGSSMMDRYGIDITVDLMDACDTLEAILFMEGNGVIGADVFEHNGQSYFAIYFKKDVLCYWQMLDAYGKQNGHNVAYFMYDTGDCFVVPETGSLVVETIKVRVEKG